jgi:hypothetical protein
MNARLVGEVTGSQDPYTTHSRDLMNLMNQRCHGLPKNGILYVDSGESAQRTS